jgi:hypothetical protein
MKTTTTSCERNTLSPAQGQPSARSASPTSGAARTSPACPHQHRLSPTCRLGGRCRDSGLVASLVGDGRCWSSHGRSLRRPGVPVPREAPMG